MSHLGRWLSALVDGELDGAERDRVLNHVAACAACRQEANAMRALKRRLTALGDTCGEAPIASRLIELARSDLAPASGVYSTVPWSAPAGPLQQTSGPRHARLGWKIATGSATSALLAIGAVAFLLGNVSGEPPVPKITPSVDSYLLQHSRDAGQEPAGVTPAGGATSAGSQSGSSSYWSHPVAPVMLDPRRPGTAQLGQLAEPVRPVTGTTAGPGPVASGNASPAASVPSSPGHASPRDSPYPHPASRNSK